MIEMHAVSEGITIQKAGNELFLFLTFTNNAIDDDYPPDIVSEESQLWFEKQVSDGVFDLPMAFYWHEPMWKFGESAFLFTSKHEEKTFSTVAVRVDPGMEKLAKAIANNADSHRVSHMMKILARDKENNIVITRHQTLEVSPLPAGKQANLGTGVVVIEKEDTMNKKSIDAGKRAAAAEALGVDEEVLDEVEQLNDARAEEISGRLSKEATVVEEVEEAAVVEEVEVQEEVEPVAEEVEPVAFVTAQQMDEVVAQLAETNKALAAQISALQQQVETLQKSVDTAEDPGTALNAIKEYIPRAAAASWVDVLKQSTKVADGNLTKEEVEKLAPTEKQQDDNDGPFAVPILNRLAKGLGA